MEARAEEITEWHLKIVCMGQFNQCFETDLFMLFQHIYHSLSWILISWNKSDLQQKFNTLSSAWPKLAFWIVRF